MDQRYVWGVVCAILAGACSAAGTLLEKRAVDRTSEEHRNHHFMRHLLRNRAWLFGLFLSLGPGSAFILLAQNLIGPALVPGLAASGMILLAIGSVRINHEHLRLTHVLGIVGMVAGATLLGLSDLGIRREEVDLLDYGWRTRLTLFTAGLALAWLVSFLAARPARGLARGLIIAVSGGFPYALSNLWTLPLLVAMPPSFAGTAHPLVVFTFAIACPILIVTNVMGVRMVQEAYKFAPASRAQPIQQIPIQIVPILIYFFLFERRTAGAGSHFAPWGVVLIIAAGFLLASRRAGPD